MRKRADGFTLVELMVVVLVIGILVAVAVPVFNAAKTTAEKNTCQSFQRTWAGVVEQAKGNDTEPTATTEGPKRLDSGSTWWTVANSYLKSVPKCPTTKSDYWVYESARGTSGNGQLVGCAGASAAEWTSGHQFFSASAGDVIVWQGLVYKVITAEDGRQWLDRNLGATQVASRPDDSAGYGWYYQWGRGNDGHQIPTSGTTTEPAGDTDAPGNLFIKATEWRDPRKDTLWTSVGGINNPCPPGFHVPQAAEWAHWASHVPVPLTDAETVYATTLRLPAAGLRYYYNGSLTSGGEVRYWCSNTSDIYAGYAYLEDNKFKTNVTQRGWGFSVRAIKN